MGLKAGLCLLDAVCNPNLRWEEWLWPLLQSLETRSLQKTEYFRCQAGGWRPVRTESCSVPGMRVTVVQTEGG